MFDFFRVLSRNAQPAKAEDPASDYHPSNKGGEGLEVEYQSLIADQFRRWGVSTSCVTFEVKRIGRAPTGFDVMACLVRLNQWEHTSGLRLLLGLPMLESKVRKAVRATWLADYSHFAGLWLHTSEQMEIPAELRELLGALAPSPASLQRRSGIPANEGTASKPFAPHSLTDSLPVSS